MRTITTKLLFAAAVLGTCGIGAACGASGTSPETDPPEAVVPATVAAHDLTDPLVRHRFACNFESGFFGPPQPTGTTTEACREPKTVEAP